MCPSNHLFHDQRDSFSQEKIYDAFVEAPGEVVNGNLVEKTCWMKSLKSLEPPQKRIFKYVLFSPLLGLLGEDFRFD